jgi:type VI secretion system protein ImpF
MSRLDSHQGLMPSVLDRLIDPESGGTVARPGYDIREMADAVQRDLEDLLNTRQTHPDLGAGFAELRSSIFCYGLPDLTSLNAITPQQREDIGRVLEGVISQFEPRLRDVRATILDAGDGPERTVRFRVDARLCVDPAPEVSFDTILELTSGHYSVKQAEP